MSALRDSMSLADAKAMLAKIRALTDDDGPECSMGAQWVLGQVQEILGGTSAHPRRASSAIWEEMLVKIGRLQRERDELQADVSRLRATVNDPDAAPRAPGCECHLEAGDSPCRIHGDDDHPLTTETP